MLKRGQGEEDPVKVEDRLIRVMTMRNLSVTATELKMDIRTAIGTRLLNSIVSRRLCIYGLKSRRTKGGVIMPASHRRRRLEWARQYQGMRQRHCTYVMFCDESRYWLHFSYGRNCVKRCHGEKFAKSIIMERDSFGWRGWFWGGISYNRRTVMLIIRGNHTGKRYVNEMSQLTVVPTANRAGCTDSKQNELELCLSRR